MVASRKQQPTCPVCHKSDQVKTMQAAYIAGNHHYAQPVMPVANVPMSKYVVIGMVLVGLGAFFIFVLSAIPGSNFNPSIEWVQVIVTLLFIVAALVLSLIAFLRVVKGDNDTRRYLPAWDRAMENWRHLYYCARDNVVFDPQADRSLSDASVRSLLATDVVLEPQVQAQSAAVSH
jgi:hypothetical protein